MAYYLLQGAYTAEAWATLLKNPVDRIEAVRPVIEKMGGSIEGAWFAFGDYDLFVVYQMPDNTTAAAFALSLAAAGVFKNAKTTPLMSINEGIEAMQKGAESGYQPPK